MLAFRKLIAAATVFAAALIPAGCGSNGTTAASASSGSDPVTTGGPLVSGGASSVYVVQNNVYLGSGSAFSTTAADNILKFNASSSGVVTPTQAFSGPSGVSISGIALDSAGNIYAGGFDSTGTGQILVYSSTATGTATPTRTITAAGLGQIDGIALDSAGNIYVDTYAGRSSTLNSITVFAANATGTATPTRTISGGLTNLVYPAGIAVDTNGTVYVADNLAGTVVGFSSSASGNVIPTKTLSMSVSPTQIALDSSNNFYLSLLSLNGTYGAVNVFPASASGTLTTPTKIVGGSALNAAVVMGAAPDTKGNIYAVYGSNSGALGVATFSATATGNATPAATFSSTAYTATRFGYITVR